MTAPDCLALPAPEMLSPASLREMADRADRQAEAVGALAWGGLRAARQVEIALEDLAAACRRAADEIEERDRRYPPLAAQRLQAHREERAAWLLADREAER